MSMIHIPPLSGSVPWHVSKQYAMVMAADALNFTLHGVCSRRHIIMPLSAVQAVPTGFDMPSMLCGAADDYAYACSMLQGQLLSAGTGNAGDVQWATRTVVLRLCCVTIPLHAATGTCTLLPRGASLL